MANKKISSLNSLGGTPDVADIIPITDVSDTTGSVNGTTKKVTVANLVAAAPQGDLVASNNLNDVASASTARTNLGLGTAATSASTDFSSAFFSIVSESTTARTLSDSDNGKVIVCSNSATVTVTIPTGLTAGFNCTIVQSGTGTVQIEGGATIYGVSSKTSTAGQYAALNVIPIGTDTYVLEGDGQAPPFANTYSVDFDGTNDYIDAGSSPSSLTVEGISVWFRPDLAYGSGVKSYLLGFGGLDIGIALGGDWFGVVADEVISVVNVNHVWSYAGSGVTISANTWHHLGIRWESSSSATNSSNAGYDIYLDGTKVGNSFGTYSSGTGSKATTQRLTAGARNRSGAIANNFNGKIDELGIFTSAVSEADLLAMYNSGSGPIDLTSYSPALWWRMGDNDGGTGTTITDQGSGGNNGTLTNGPTFSTTVP
jgi:hypothetical protein